MANKIQTVPTTRNLPEEGRQLTERLNALCDVLDIANNLIRYPLKEQDLQAWSRQLNRLFPDLSVIELRFLLDKFAEDDLIEWDPNKGIQNIVKGLKRVYVDANGYYQINPIA